jgi:hypothetical protein
MEDVKPLLARIQALKSDDGGSLSGTQLMAFFLQRRVQPLQHRLSKLWSFSGLGDFSRVSDDLMEKKDLDKRVRALTTLTKEDEIPDLAAGYFDFEHHLPAVCALFSFIRLLLPYHFYLIIFGLFLLPGSSVPCFSPPLPEGGPIQNVPADAASEAPEVEDSQDEDEAEDSLERTSLTTSPPPAVSEDLGVDKKRKHVEELASSSASAHKTVAEEVSALGDEEELFDALDS